MQITQTELPLTIKCKCYECGRPIKKGLLGRACKRKVYANVVDLITRKIPKKYYPLIKEFLESEGV